MIEDQYDDQKDRTEEDELWRAFNEYDLTGMGKIPTSDIEKALADLGEKITPFRIVHMIAQVDPENSGYVAFAQFK